MDEFLSGEAVTCTQASSAQRTPSHAHVSLKCVDRCTLEACAYQQTKHHTALCGEGLWVVGRHLRRADKEPRPTHTAHGKNDHVTC